MKSLRLSLKSLKCNTIVWGPNRYHLYYYALSMVTMYKNMLGITGYQM